MRGTTGDGHDSSHTGGRDPQHDRNYPRSKRRQDDRDRREQHYRQDRDPGYNGRNKEMDSRSHQSLSDYRDPHSQEARQPRQGNLEMYTEASSSPLRWTNMNHSQDKHCTTSDIFSRQEVMEILLNMLIVICAGVSYNSSGGYRDLASLGGLYAYYFGGANAFTGAEADRVKELDAQFYQLKLPPYIFSMACGGALMGYACAMLVLGVLRVPFRWPIVLLVEAVVDGLIGLGYIPALAFYFIKLQENYNSAICKEREQMYQSKGHQGFECKLHGADIGGGLFGVLGIIAFPCSAVLAIRAFRTVRERKRRKAQRDP